MASNNGEERRRRITERGSDRMALITGRINSLPPTAPSSSPTHSRHAQSMSVSAFDSHFDNEPSLPSRRARPHSLASSAFVSSFEQDNAGNAENNKHDVSTASRLRHQGGFKYSNYEPKYEDDEPLQQNSKTTKTTSSSEAKQTESLNTNQAKKPQNWRRHAFFSSRELNFCILASENTRALSSLIIALAVVLSHAIFSKSIFASKPLYVVLVTDVTIVVARVYREKGQVLQESQGAMAVAGEDGHNWGDAVVLLERGLVLYQAIRGVFIDCSIYLVVVVCCISLM